MFLRKVPFGTESACAKKKKKGLTGRPVVWEEAPGEGKGRNPSSHFPISSGFLVSARKKKQLPLSGRKVVLEVGGVSCNVHVMVSQARPSPLEEGGGVGEGEGQK